MKQYKVGEKYEEFLYKGDVAAMKFIKKRADIFILQKDPSDTCIYEILNSRPFFQIYTKNNIIFLLIKFGNLDWIDIPYVHSGISVLEINDDEYGYPCRIFFANSTSGVLLGKRYVCFSNGLSKAFYFAVKEQQKHLPKNILEKINSIRASFHPNEIARLSLGR